ncbi:MAG: HlyC/CorC family transporter [Spirochaetota bacterium]|nr:HlyC/CorC family transporter [Spirochaetota bacterium]
MDISFILFILSIFLIGISAFLSASETAFFSLDELKIRTFKQQDVRVIRKLLKKATLLLATILIANTTTNILLITILETLFNTLGFDFNLIWLTIIVSGIVIFFGEILPKSFASAQVISIIPIILAPLEFISVSLSKIATPINNISIWLTNKFEHLLPEVESKDDRRRALYNIVSRGQFLKTEEKILIGRILSLAERKVTAVMTPRPRVFSMDAESTLMELRDELIIEQHSKIPVYKEQDSNVIGVIFFEDIAVKFRDRVELDHSILEYIRPIYFVPESKTLGSLLDDFREKNIHMAAVVDEYGEFLGIITLSDIMAELVGEVVDEDFDDQEIAQQLPNRFIVKGEVSLIDFNEKFITILASEEYETIAGFLIEHSGGLPPLYYTFENDQVIITVRERSSTRIESLSVRLKS